MDWRQFLIPIIENISPVYASIALLTIIFSWFFIKRKFKSEPSFKRYAIFFYAFVFLCLGVLSFLVLNAQSEIIRLEKSFLPTPFLFLVYIIIPAAFGAFTGWLMFNAARLVEPNKINQLLNISLLIIAPALLYVMLFKPFLETFEYIGLKRSSVKIEEGITGEYNPNSFLVQTITPKGELIPAVSQTVFDSCLVQLKNGNSLDITLTNGFNYQVKLMGSKYNQLMVAKCACYLAVLSINNNQQLAEIAVIDNTGIKQYGNVFKNANQLSVINNRYVVIGLLNLDNFQHQTISCIDLDVGTNCYK